MAEATIKRITPMMKQYLEAKSLHPEAILFFRMGDFYEMFYDDARTAAQELDLTLTSRDKDKGDDAIPMAGIPHHAADNYVAKLIGKGFKVAICEQVEDPKKAKGIVKRQVTKVVTPGMVVDPQTLLGDKPNYLAAMAINNDEIDLGFLDYLTGECRCTQFDNIYLGLDEIRRLQPSEILFSSDNEDRIEDLLKHEQDFFAVSKRPGKDFDQKTGEQLTKQLFPELEAPEQFEQRPSMWGIIGALLAYTQETQGQLPDHLSEPQWYQLDQHLVLDEASRRNLELVRTSFEGKKHGSLLWHLDRCRTSMGSRLLQKWMLYPLKSTTDIHTRLDFVESFVQYPMIRTQVRKQLAQVKDIERLVGRLGTNQATPRDLLALAQSCLSVGPLREQLASIERFDVMADFLTQLNELPEFYHTIIDALDEDSPPTIGDGGIFKVGYNAELDELISLCTEGKNIILQLVEEEKKKTGINSLKIKYNKVFGYYIEVTKANIAQVPQHYIRKQTTVNAERYITPELKEYEDKILNAQDKRKRLEQSLYEQLREALHQYLTELKQLAYSIAFLDTVAALADVAAEWNYTRPILRTDNVISIKEGRHPVIERLSRQLGEQFVPNDISLDQDQQQLVIVTGPNMAGKSTVMRQVALITLLAQMGSFVPAEAAAIGVRDRIFTRVGASDALHRGQSTFMVEMMETSSILTHATSQSLVILDEIGRGTSTFDGLSIAWAVAEYLHNNIHALTMFATHYHELTDLTHECKYAKNYNIQVREWNDEIVFLRQIAPGAASRSYGIQVARLAGLPTDVVERALEILETLEEGEYDQQARPRLAKSNIVEIEPPRQLYLFGPDAPPSEVENEIRSLHLNDMTPLEALTKLQELQNKLSSKK